MKTMFIYFLVAFLGLSFLFGIVYFINKKFFKEKKIFKIFYIVSLIIFIATYIQGNYLVGDLPVLTGDEIEWGNYLVNDIITVFIWIALIVSSVILCKKYKIEEVIKTSVYVVGAIFLMLLTSMLPSLFTENMFLKKDFIEITTENLNVASTDKNYYIFLVDSVDSQMFNDVLQKSNYSDTLNDFTYYPDTLAGYPYTRDSIPLILTGKWNKNEKSFIDYYKESMNNSELFNELDKQGYIINIYEDENLSLLDNNDFISNIKTSHSVEKLFILAKQETKYIAFRYLPYFLKKYTHVYFSNHIETNDDNLFYWSDKFYYDFIDKYGFETTDEKMFHFLHLEGAHQPFLYDEDLNEVSYEEGSYEKKVGATIKTINKFITELKESGQYDNSIIIVMADHGYSTQENMTTIDRMNPILYIKRINEKHDKIIISDKQISFNDIFDGLMDLLNDKEPFQDITNHEKRIFIESIYNSDATMFEWVTEDKAWEISKMKRTGNKFKKLKGR